MKTHPIHHSNGKPDMRYSVEWEYTGQANPQYVARFCGEWIGSSASRSSAVLKCVCHNAQRNGAQPIEGIEKA